MKQVDKRADEATRHTLTVYSNTNHTTHKANEDHQTQDILGIPEPGRENIYISTRLISVYTYFGCTHTECHRYDCVLGTTFYRLIVYE